jgi:hypothetical protein
VKPHTPPTQVVVALGTLGHATPQAPQLFTLVLVFVSQPLFALPSQFAKGALHVNPQLPPTQVVVAFVRAGQTLLQEPQFWTSVAVLTHWLPHLVKGALHSKPHTPPTQVVVALATLGHATPQAPQLFTLVLVFVSQPLASLLSQLAKGALHVNPQLPPMQVVVAFVRAGQTLPQLPQFCRSVAVLTH